RGFLHPRQWLASSMTCSAIFLPHFAPILRSLLQQCCRRGNDCPSVYYNITGFQVYASPIGRVSSLHSAEKSVNLLCNFDKVSASGLTASSRASEVETGSVACLSRASAPRRAPSRCR